MSGHSHWSKVKYKKGTTDAQKGKAFSKMARLISIAARQGGNPNENAKLREAIEKAKTINMPSANVERAVKRGAGETEAGKLQEVIFEAYGASKVALIIEGITDNKNRALAEIKHILSQNNGKLASEGSVRWLFERKAVINLNSQEQPENFKNKEKLELLAIDAGAQDISWKNEYLEIYAEPKDLEKVKQKLQEQNLKIASVDLEWMAKEKISLSPKDKEATEKLFLVLDENETVQEIYSNLL